MKVKQFVMVILALMVVFLSACGTSSTTTSTTNSSENKVTTDSKPEGSKLEDKVVLGTWGGSWGDMAQTSVFNPYKKENPGVEIVADVSGSSADILAKMEAQRSNPQMDLVTMTELMTIKAIKSGLLAEVSAKDVPELNEVYDVAKIDPYGSAILLADIGIAYNPKVIKDPPKSWNDLLDPKYKGKIALATIGNTSTISFLVMAARLNGGDEKNIDPGFKFIEKLKPNVSTLYKTDADIQALFQRGEVDIAVWWNGPAIAAKKAGVDVNFVVPKEGSPVIRSMVSLVKGAPHPNAAKKMIGNYLNQVGQKAVAQNIFYGPVNKNVIVSDDIKDLMPYHESIDKLMKLDWGYIADQTSGWTQRWDQLFGK